MLSITPDSRFAHRGLHDATRPENSLSALVAAAESGYGIEFDIHLSSDGIPFVSHDPDTLRDTGEEHLIGATHSERLRELTFRGTGDHLATLDDVMREIAPAVPMLVELKPTRRVRETVAEVVRRLTDREQSAALQSFQPGLVREVQRQRRGFAAGQLAEGANPRMHLAERLYWRTLFTNTWVRPDFLAVHVSALTEPAVRMWRAVLRAPLLGWTVVDADDVAACHSVGAGMIFESIRPDSYMVPAPSEQSGRQRGMP